MLNKFTPIDKLLKAAKRGEIFILVDDERRENEGDLVFWEKNARQKNQLYGKAWERFDMFGTRQEAII